MGYEMFLVLLNMSLSAALVIAAVLVVRLFLRKAPRVISYCLWAVVLFKLLCPVSFSLPVSLPETEGGPVVEQGIVYYIPKDLLYDRAAAPGPEAPAFAEVGGTGSGKAGNTGNTALPGGREKMAFGEGWGLMRISAAVWAAGAALMLAWGGISMAVLKGKLRGACAVSCAQVQGRIAVYEKRDLPTPFVLGILRPGIYLPAGLSESEKRYILLHEQIHIRRGDPVVRAVSYFALCIHWFNPMVWAAFYLSERDMEMACDEAVLRRLGDEIKKEYSAALLNLAVGRRIIGSMPPAFGEGNPGARIKNVLKYKKPQLAAVCIGVVFGLTAAVLLLASPRSGDSAQQGGGETGNVPEESIPEGGEGEGTDGNAPGESGNPEMGSAQNPAGADPEEENRTLRAMVRGEALTWEKVQELAAGPLPELESYAGYEGAVWDDMEGRALNRYLTYDLRDGEKGEDYRLLVSYMAEDNRINLIYLERKSDSCVLSLYRDETGWLGADIDGFLAHIPTISDWIAEYRLPKESLMQADAFSANVGDGGGQTWQWIGKDMPPAVEYSEFCPEEWKAAAAVLRMAEGHFVYAQDGSGILEDFMFMSNHSWTVGETAPVEGCAEQAVLLEFVCELFTLPEIEVLEAEIGRELTEEELTARFWYVCFGREGAPNGYAAVLNKRYFTREDAVEFAKSIRFTEEAWQ